MCPPLRASLKRGHSNVARRGHSYVGLTVLLAHGARIDHIAHDGTGLRDVVLEARGREHGEIPPQLAALEARLR